MAIRSAEPGGAAAPTYVFLSYAFTPDGRMVFQKHLPPEAKRNELDLTGDEDRLHGTIFTHNHPLGWDYAADDPRRAGSSFSPDDILLASKTNLHELRAVSPMYRFSLRPSGEGWPSADAIARAYDLVELRWQQRFLASIRDGTMNIFQADAEHFHETWEEVAQLLGLIYIRERR